MFAAKARQAMVRNQSTVGKADSIGEAIDKWETTELEKVEAKAKLLGCALPCRSLLRTAAQSVLVHQRCLQHLTNHQ